MTLLTANYKLYWAQLLTVTLAMTETIDISCLSLFAFVFFTRCIAINTVACIQRDLNVMLTLHCPPWTRTCPLCSCHIDTVNHFPRYWPFVRGIHRSPVNSPHKSQWRGDLMFSLICVWINSWVNNREAGDLRRYRAHYDVTVMSHDIYTWRWPLVLLHSRTTGEVTNYFSSGIFSVVCIPVSFSHLTGVATHRGRGGRHLSNINMI